MHTFELSCNILPVSYQHLHDNLPLLMKVSGYVERTNYYAQKGIMQIELRTYEYAKHGVMKKEHYLVLRCNPSIILGDSKILLVDLEKYSPAEILEKLMKRIMRLTSCDTSNWINFQ